MHANVSLVLSPEPRAGVSYVFGGVENWLAGQGRVPVWGDVSYTQSIVYFSSSFSSFI